MHASGYIKAGQIRTMIEQSATLKLSKHAEVQDE